MDWTHEDMLSCVAELCKSEERPDCILVIALWNADQIYDTRFWNVGLKVTEMIALLDVQKDILLDVMRREREDQGEP
jgi:hypothetical protein